MAWVGTGITTGQGCNEGRIGIRWRGSEADILFDYITGADGNQQKMRFVTKDLQNV